MYNRKPQEEVVKEETKIWECASPDCNGWIRDNFTSEAEPLCPLCQSSMSEASRLLEVVHNPSRVIS
ncbi:cold-shock protein [Mangrovibacillus cuniculi]|uniref:Cold-shock protein n=1 Tax=Mangrovibacillus cuniculi TaxID=2593652 RepID=A0A7S8CAR1_9BACI|nr:cold-shock protein [Mangrovibacillus cuniculi]QPC46531.1 cold-shock protein [Mangrovibacillus cuniculi]